jgi:hypothetical protein
MSASSFRRLPFLFLVAALAFPSQAAAVTWDLGNLLSKAQGIFSALWAPVGCEIEPSGRCGAAPSPVLREHGCEINSDGRCASGPASGGNRQPLLGEIGCEIEPDGRCRS